MAAYGITRELPDLPFDTAVERITDTMKAEGFGVLTTIDVQATLKGRLGVDHPRYVILGACNPPLAHQALVAEPLIGLLLPCNVVVMERAEGGSVVSLLNPKALFGLVGRPEIAPLAEAVTAKLERALAAV